MTISGTIVVNDGCCSSGCGSAASNLTTRVIGSSSSEQFTGISSTDCPILVQTSGVVGTQYIDLPGVDVSSVGFLHFSSNLPVSVRLGAGEARLVGSGASFPVVMSGGEEITFVLDGTSVVVTFTAGSKSAQDCANAINSAAALAGLQYQPASASPVGQLEVETNQTGTSSTAVVGSTVTASIGFVADTSVTGLGADISCKEMLVRPDAEITRIQISTGASGALVNVLAGSKL
jgi:hypothetical protein